MRISSLLIIIENAFDYYSLKIQEYQKTIKAYYSFNNVISTRKQLAKALKQWHSDKRLGQYSPYISRYNCGK